MSDAGRGPRGDGYGGDPYDADRYGSDRYASDRYGSDGYGSDRYAEEAGGWDDGDALPSGARETASPYYPDRGEPLRAPWDPAEPVPGRRRSVPGGRDHLPRQSALGRFVHTWGWRAYAIPILLVLTALVVADVVRNPQGHDDAAVQDPTNQVVSDAPAVAPDVVPEDGTLPDGGPYTEDGDETYRVVAGSGERVGKPGAQDYTYTVEIENPVDTTDFGGDDSVGRMIDSTLDNPKSWTADGKVALRRIDHGEPSFRVSLTSPMTVREHCGYDIKLESSCYNPEDGRVYLNLARWVRCAGR